MIALDKETQILKPNKGILWHQLEINTNNNNWNRYMWFVIRPQNCTNYYELPTMNNAGFTYRLDRLKHRASKFRGPPAKVYIFFNTVIGLSHLCCHNVLYFLNNPSRILQHFKHPSSSLPLLKLIKHTSIFIQSWRWEIGRGIANGLA